MNPLIEEWKVDPLYVKAVELWVEYYDKCQAYDDSICRQRGPSGFACPLARDEFAKSNKFAREERKVLLFQMDQAEIPNETRKLANPKALAMHEALWPRGEPGSLI